MIKLIPYILLEKYINILALEMASPGNRHCANSVGTLSFPIKILQEWACCLRAASSLLKAVNDGEDLGYNDVTLLIGVVVATVSIACISLPVLIIGLSVVDWSVHNYSIYRQRFGKVALIFHYLSYIITETLV